MKKILAVALAVAALMAFPLSARAEEKQKIDLSGMSYEDLVELKDQINLAIWQSDEWQEVEVPQGVWKVGEDIPVGHWTIKPMPGERTQVIMGKELTNGGTSVSLSGAQTMEDKDNKYYKDGKSVTEWSIDLEEGMYLQINAGTAIFTPYAGKPSLGFKK